MPTAEILKAAIVDPRSSPNIIINFNINCQSSIITKHHHQSILREWLW